MMAGSHILRWFSVENVKLAVYVGSADEDAVEECLY